MTTAASKLARWKKAETQVGSILGGKRVPTNGRQRGSAPDIEGPAWLAIECKNRKVVPAWIEEGMKQAEASAAVQGGDPLPLVIVHKVGTRYKDSLVVLRLSEFQDRFGEVTDSSAD